MTPPATPPAAVPTYRPDAEIRKAKGAFVGQGIDKASDQQVTGKIKGRAKRYDVRGPRDQPGATRRTSWPSAARRGSAEARRDTPRRRQGRSPAEALDGTFLRRRAEAR